MSCICRFCGGPTNTAFICCDCGTSNMPGAEMTKPAEGATPRTDAARQHGILIRGNLRSQDRAWVPAELSKDLERELAEAKQTIIEAAEDAANTEQALAAAVSATARLPAEPTDQQLWDAFQSAPRLRSIVNPWETSPVQLTLGLRAVWKAAMLDASLPQAEQPAAREDDRRDAELSALRQFYTAWKAIKEFGGRYTFDMAEAEEALIAASSATDSNAA